MSKKNKNLAKKEAIKGFSISSIYLIYAAIFWGYPFVWLFILVFSKWKFVGSPQFVGFKNITRVLSDPLFWKTVLNVFRFMLYYIPLVILGAMLFAIALNKLKYGKTFVTLSFLVANVSSGVAYSIMFSNLFAVNGPINKLLYNLFGVTIPWFTSPSLA
ncbi:MAG: sugar ABC transporter permease, partial [Defluviitoga tunisiensis]